MPKSVFEDLLKRFVSAKMLATSYYIVSVLGCPQDPKYLFHAPSMPYCFRSSYFIAFSKLKLETEAYAGHRRNPDLQNHVLLSNLKHYVYEKLQVQSDTS